MQGPAQHLGKFYHESHVVVVKQGSGDDSKAAEGHMI